MVLTTKGKLTIALVVLVVIALIVWLVYTFTSGGDGQTTSDTAFIIQQLATAVNTMGRPIV